MAEPQEKSKSEQILTVQRDYIKNVSGLASGLSAEMLDAAELK